MPRLEDVQVHSRHALSPGPLNSIQRMYQMNSRYYCVPCVGEIDFRKSQHYIFIIYYFVLLNKRRGKIKIPSFTITARYKKNPSRF